MESRTDGEQLIFKINPAISSNSKDGALDWWGEVLYNLGLLVWSLGLMGTHNIRPSARADDVPASNSEDELWTDGESLISNLIFHADMRSE